MISSILQGTHGMVSSLRTVISFLAATAIVTATEVPSGPAEITLVDGRTLQAEVLFRHPHAELVILRSPTRTTVQSLPLAIIQTIKGRRSTATEHAARTLSADEERDLAANGLWGDAVGSGQIGAYAKQAWPEQPLVVWAKPGESGDAFDPGNWLDAHGKPLSELHWITDEALAQRRGVTARTFDGDVLLPAAATPYRVLQAGNRDNLPAFSVRHLTLESGTSYEVRYTITGNLWMKSGATLGAGTQTGGFGAGEANRHTFARFCEATAVAEPAWAYAHHISHWLRIDTGTASLEIIGFCGGPSDRVTLSKGTLVISENSSMKCGDRAAFFTAPGTTLILLDGAMLASPSPLKGGSGGNIMGTYGIAGNLFFGTPEKPLRRDLEFSACFYPEDRVNKKGNPSDRASGASWIFGPTSRAVIHSADPTTARVTFRPRDITTMPTNNISRELKSRYENRNKVRGYGPAKPGLWNEPSIPKGCYVLFRGATDFNGVVFDGFPAGGIIVDPAAAKAWKNVTYGPANKVPPAQLFQSLE